MAAPIFMTPAQMQEAAGARRENRLEKRLQEATERLAAAKKGNPALIADPANLKWRLKFKHIPSRKRVNLSGWVTSFSDNLNSNWNEESVYGRMDPLVTFQNTQRTISIAFDVVSENKYVATRNSAAVTKLQAFLYPGYNEGNQANSNTLKAAPLIEFGWANLVTATKPGRNLSSGKGLIGYIDAINYTPDIDSGFFLADGNKMVPQLLRISFNFKVIHTDLRGWSEDHKPGIRASGYSAPKNSTGKDLRKFDAAGERGGGKEGGSIGSAINISNLEQHKRNTEIVKAEEQRVLASWVGGRPGPQRRLSAARVADTQTFGEDD